MKKNLLMIGLVAMGLLAGCGEKTEAAKPALQTAAQADTRPASPGGFFKKPPGTATTTAAPVEPAASTAAAPVVVAPSPKATPVPVTAPAPAVAAKGVASAPAASPSSPHAKPVPKAAPAVAPATQKTVLAEASKKKTPPATATVPASAPVPVPVASLPDKKIASDNVPSEKLGPIEVCSKKANAFLKEICIAKECLMNSQHAQCIAISKERGSSNSNVN